MTMKTILRRRDVRLLLTGQSLSMFGDWMMIIVLGIWTKVLTGSNGGAEGWVLAYGLLEER